MIEHGEPLHVWATFYFAGIITALFISQYRSVSKKEQKNRPN